MGRSSDSVTRVDIRFSNDMYEQIQQVAIKEGARTHHISQKVEVSPTIIKLVQMGLDALSGKLPDIISDVSDRLSDKSLNVLSDKSKNLSDMSDKRVESIVDKRLTELGLFPGSQIIPTSRVDNTLDSLPDKNELVPDILPDKSDIISDKVDSLPDILSDTKNIPSDDSSNSESIAEDVQITQTDEIEQVSGEIPQSFSFKEFHDWLNIPQPDKRNKANGDIAITIAKDRGLGDWEMNSTSRKFTKITGV